MIHPTDPPFQLEEKGELQLLYVAPERLKQILGGTLRGTVRLDIHNG